VMVALATLGAVGAAAMLAGRGRAVGTSLLSAVVVGVVAEGYGGPFPIAPLAAALTESRLHAYDWLASQETEAAVIELPFSPLSFSPVAVATPPAVGLPATIYQYASLRHGRPLVNGASGFTPAFASALEDEESQLRRPAAIEDALQDLRRLGVRHVVMHRDIYDDQHLASRLAPAIRACTCIVAEQEFGPTLVFELAERVAVLGGPGLAR
jgi:hypothetical protein